jgi:hypothetical protein
MLGYGQKTRNGRLWGGLLGGIGLVVFSLGMGSTLVRAAPRAVAQQAPAGIEGLWLIHADPTNPAAQELAVLAPGGLMFASSAPVSSVEPGQGPPGVTQFFSSQGFGVWASQGSGGYTYKFLTINYDQTGSYLNTTTIAGTLTMDASGNSLNGTYTVSLITPDGTTTELVPVTPLTGTRVTAT